MVNTAETITFTTNNRLGIVLNVIPCKNFNFGTRKQEIIFFIPVGFNCFPIVEIIEPLSFDNWMMALEKMLMKVGKALFQVIRQQK